MVFLESTEILKSTDKIANVFNIIDNYVLSKLALYHYNFTFRETLEFPFFNFNFTGTGDQVEKFQPKSAHKKYSTTRNS